MIQTVSKETTIVSVILALIIFATAVGFYDRTVAGLRGSRRRVTLIGIAYEGQRLGKIPVGPFDMPLDAVLSPAGISEFESSRKL